MWDERYSREEYVYGKEPNDFLLQKVSLLKAGKVLCLADGEGRNSVFLASKGHDVTAIDQSKVGLEKTKKLADEKGVKVATVQGDLADYVIAPESWDSVVSIFCHLPSVLRQQLHRKVIAGLKPGGIFLLEAYTPDQLRFGTGGPPMEDMMMTLGTLKEELAGMQFLHAQELKREVVEGIFHTGMGAVVQLVARKAE